MSAQSRVLLMLSADDIHSLDLDFPLDCDDDRWIPCDGSPAFKQPDDLPSHVSAFIWTLKLSQILGSALRTLVGDNNPWTSLLLTVLVACKQ